MIATRDDAHAVVRTSPSSTKFGTPRHVVDRRFPITTLPQCVTMGITLGAKEVSLGNGGGHYR